MLTHRIRIIRHEAVPKTGSFEVRFADGRESKYFYFDDMPGRRLRPDILTSEQPLEQAKALARELAFIDVGFAHFSDGGFLRLVGGHDTHCTSGIRPAER